MTKSHPCHTVLCFGEMLWDSLPRGLFPGGAPMNVAYHLHRLGLRAAPVSAVGRDALGDELLRRVKQWGLDTRLIHRRKDKPTGLVRVNISKTGPTYEIVKNVAWDWIELPKRSQGLLKQTDALVFGTLAQRAPHNRRQFQQLLKYCDRALKVFDVNLRPPYDSSKLVWFLARSADLIKLNHDEAKQLLRKNYTVKQLEHAARDFSREAGCPNICITAGSAGAGLLMNSHWAWLPGKPIKVKDTVGAGDSFLGALVHGLLTGNQSPEKILQHASDLAEFVAMHEGATPAYSVSATGKIHAK